MYRAVFAVFFLLFWGFQRVCAQDGSAGITDGRGDELICGPCQSMMLAKPIEVQHGFFFDRNGDIYFSINNEEWFNKFLRPGMSITADLVSRDRYDCKSPTVQPGIFRGYVLPPIARDSVPLHRKVHVAGEMLLLMGRMPEALRKKEVEASLVILHQGRLCYYTNYLNIDRAVWELLPMGMFTDGLVNTDNRDDSVRSHRVLYTQKIQFAVPFAKNSQAYEGSDIKHVLDSLKLSNIRIKRAEIRAYTSVEGSEEINQQLMKGRGNVIASLLRSRQRGLTNIQVVAAENWLDFYQQIGRSHHSELGGLTRSEIKLRLQDGVVAEDLEPMLANERKSLVTLYYDQDTHMDSLGGKNILRAFQDAVAHKQVERARGIQREVLERIADNRLPESYLGQLEVPNEKGWWQLMNDHAIYAYQLNLMWEGMALEELSAAQALDPNNGKINYNICVLQLHAWQNASDSSAKEGLEARIQALSRQGIHPSLIKRMLLNYYILLAYERYMAHDYAGKDNAIVYIRENFKSLPLTDKDRFVLAKYFSFYSRFEWAEQLVKPRVEQIDVSEDLVFYYVNLGFFHDTELKSAMFEKALLNASILNRPRYCAFFHSVNVRGDAAGMQLLEYPMLRQLFCERCSLK